MDVEITKLLDKGISLIKSFKLRAAAEYYAAAFLGITLEAIGLYVTAQPDSYVLRGFGLVILAAAVFGWARRLIKIGSIDEPPVKPLPPSRNTNRLPKSRQKKLPS